MKFIYYTFLIFSGTVLGIQIKFEEKHLFSHEFSR